MMFQAVHTDKYHSLLEDSLNCLDLRESPNDKQEWFRTGGQYLICVTKSN